MEELKVIIWNAMWQESKNNKKATEISQKCFLAIPKHVIEK